MKKVLVTGACGLLGSEVCRNLVDAGFDVRATDLNSRTDLPAEIISADIRNAHECLDLVDGIDTVVHLAANPTEYLKDPVVVYSENVGMTVNIMQACVRKGVENVIYASSIQAITANRPVPEKDSDISPCTLPYLPADGNIPAQPSNLYGLSKQACEEMLRFFCRRYSMTCIAFRFPWLMNKEQKERFLPVYRSSMPKRICLDECFAYLTTSDAARLIRATLDSSITGFRIFMPAAAQPLVSVPAGELIRKYYAGIAMRVPLENVDCLVDLSGITSEIGWAPWE